MKTSTWFAILILISNSSYAGNPTFFTSTNEITMTVPQSQPNQPSAPPAEPPSVKVTPPGLEGLPLCKDLLPKKDPNAPVPELKVPEVFRVTRYDDGKSCPGSCKEDHVVFDSRHNGTSRAHSPGSAGPNYRACVKGQKCEICFKENDPGSCMNIKYEGQGPPFGRFDFPIVFFKNNCDGSKYDSLPSPAQAECDSLKKGKAKLAQEGRLNCIANPKHELCKETMDRALAAQKDDEPKFKKCKEMGSEAFNKTQTSDDEKRTEDCSYSKKSFAYKTNVKGNSCRAFAKRLLPGACPKGSLVDSVAMNCCSGDLLWQAALGGGCSKYFPKIPASQQVSTSNRK